MTITITDSENYTIITASLKSCKSLSWEELQSIKDRFFPKKDFIEIYPKKQEIINKANERHLIHIKKFNVPMMCDFEEELNSVEIIEC